MKGMIAMTEYEKHFNFIASVTDAEKLSEEDINEQFQLLLSILPNNGKLYKYRSLQGESFENIYDCLEKGYMWIGKASALNDDFDSNFFGNPVKQIGDAITYLLSDPALLIYSVAKKQDIRLFDSPDDVRKLPLQDIALCMNPQTGELDEIKAAQLLFNCGGDYESALIVTTKIKELVGKIIAGWGQQVELLLITFLFANFEARNKTHVFSMSDSYDLSNMWGYYADSGKGFCIEYDYHKAACLNSQYKWYILNTFMVEYSECPKEISFQFLIDQLIHEKEDPSLYLSFAQSVFHQFLRKEKCWEYENEWRIVLSEVDSQVPIDIVSGVIIDERSMDTENAKRLIQLCRQRNWSVKIRKCNVFQTAHSYEDYIEQEAQ